MHVKECGSVEKWTSLGFEELSYFHGMNQIFLDDDE